MAQAKKGDTVKINFTGKLEDGTVFDTTLKQDDCCGPEDDCTPDDCGCEHGPMELVVGEENFFTQIDEALVGMSSGEKVTVTVTCEDAFGDYDEENVFSVDRSEFPEDLVPELEQTLEMASDEEDEDGMVVTVVDVTDETVTLDANHPLAGEDLTFEVELVEIVG